MIFYRRRHLTVKENILRYLKVSSKLTLTLTRSKKAPLAFSIEREGLSRVSQWMVLRFHIRPPVSKSAFATSR